MSAISNMKIPGVRKETDSLGEVDVPNGKLWGAQTQRSVANIGFSDTDVSSIAHRNTESPYPALVGRLEQSKAD